MSDEEATTGAAKATPEQGPIAKGLGIALVVAVFSLGAWGVVSVGSCTWRVGSRMATNIKKEVAEADKMIEVAEANERAEKAATAGDLSDAVVLASAQKAIKDQAVDPDSVRFRNQSVHRQDSGMKAVCGEFNAKNRAGGYNGYERFISAGVGKYTWTEAGVSDFNSAWNSLCKG